MANSAWQATIQDSSGNIVEGAEVQVLFESSGTPATIYSDRAGTPLVNPFLTGSTGFAQFYAPAGNYRVVATKGAFTNTWRDQRLGDSQGYDVQTSPTDTTAGRLMAVGAFGSGSNDSPLITSDLDNEIIGGSYFVSASAPNNPSGAIASLSVQPINSTNTVQILTDRTTLEMYVRGRDTGVWSDWQPVYTGANLNPSVFSGNSSEFLASDGYGRTASKANIYFPLLSNSKPTSITVVGSFSVDTVDFVSRGTVTSANMALQGISTGKVARVDISGLSGVVTSEPLILRAASAGSSITFNF